MRVYRPVPPTQHLIINPDGATPLQLNVGEGANFAPQAGAALSALAVGLLEGRGLRG